MTSIIQVNLDLIMPEIQFSKTHFGAACDVAQLEESFNISLLIKHRFMLKSAAPRGLSPRICCPHRGSVSGLSLWVTPMNE